MNIREQAEGILVRFIVGNAAVHQKQVGLGRFFQAPAELVGLGIEAHTETVRKNPMNVVQNCRIGVKNCNLRLGAVLSLHWPHNLRAHHFSNLDSHKNSCVIFPDSSRSWEQEEDEELTSSTAANCRKDTPLQRDYSYEGSLARILPLRSGNSIPTNANYCTTRGTSFVEVTQFIASIDYYWAVL